MVPKHAIAFLKYLQQVFNKTVAWMDEHASNKHEQHIAETTKLVQRHLHSLATVDYSKVINGRPGEQQIGVDMEGLGLELMLLGSHIREYGSVIANRIPKA